MLFNGFWAAPVLGQLCEGERCPSCSSPVLWPPSEGSGDVDVNPLGCIQPSLLGAVVEDSSSSIPSVHFSVFQKECVLVVSQLAAHPRRGVRTGRVRSEKTHGLRERVEKVKQKPHKAKQTRESIPYHGQAGVYPSPRKAGKINVITPKPLLPLLAPALCTECGTTWLGCPWGQLSCCVPSQPAMHCHLP